ncbi:putative bifunctional diguanylate cyclase/phosphodiesterase [Kineococcus rhizosphaerae]|uniref:Diguanylate cyclase/phosphodiesterase n=1 Tax=Kineococcus rhizosphaerae TaxID=559628 RepID=A0A2T0R3B8_9ACTN|nr:bifunctional diguanylate cyclase/phosphodiesterase [Kineococcus rhizosphaerae]PRY14557.1 diguanylate cyclase/phosphodiesterase [Kineococcus rhizosphaerae]
MARASSAPLFATTRVMGLTAGAFWTAGGTAAFAVIGWAPFPHPRDRTVLLVLATAAVLGGLLLARWGRHLPRVAFHGAAAAGTLLITLAVPLCPTTATALALTTVYSFVAIDVMFFFGWASGIAHLLSLFAAAAWALHGRAGVTPGVGATLAVVCVVITVVVGALVRRASDAQHDSLTGLRNRRGFDAALDAELLRTRHGAPLAAALLDVDHFKTVNDGQGHAAGDRLLQQLSAQLQEGLPAGAVLARYGGDEFALLLPGCSGAAALDLVDRLRATLAGAGCSAGVAGHLPGESGADLVRRADTALYAAKLAGRGRSRLDDLDSTELAHDLAQALAAGDVRAWFQPVVSPATGTLVGVEALARWLHPERGLVRPDEFITVAETTGLILDLGAAVLADACRGAVELARVHGPGLLLTVNVSGRELVAEGYGDRTLAAVRASGWPLEQLVVEVTESLLDASSGPALQALHRLRSAGVRVAIDDFGTGYSAFSRLDTLPADYLKLDHGFTAQITTSERRAGLLQALLSLSDALGLQVVAEGVEHEEQAALLASLGCPLAQGYLFSRPLPLDELLAAAPARQVARTTVGTVVEAVTA